MSPKVSQCEPCISFTDISVNTFPPIILQEHIILFTTGTRPVTHVDCYNRYSQEINRHVWAVDCPTHVDICTQGRIMLRGCAARPAPDDHNIHNYISVLL